MKKIIFAACIAAVTFLSLNQEQVKASDAITIELPKIKYTKTKTYHYNDEDVHWLALNMYHEARGEGDKGMIAVSHVVLNRARSGTFPDSVRNVITQKNAAGCQFSWYCDGKSDVPEERDAWVHCILLARVILDTYNPDTYNSDIMFYHAKKVDPIWTNEMIKVASIGNHIYYKE
jgi:N-acetylmuramoyl-L-alanine amidase